MEKARFAKAKRTHGADVTQSPADPPAAAPVIIKKYANRRLYNTASSSYVTLEHLSEMVRAGVDFTVQDAKTGDDITRAVLAQIIFEQESRGQNLLPAQFLRRLIRFYGDSMQSFLPAYLDMSMDGFTRGQDQLRDQFSRTFQAKNPLATFEDQARQNMAMFEQAIKLWAPFAVSGLPGAAESKPPPARNPASEGDAVDSLRRQMELMQAQLDELAAERARRKP